MFSEKILQLIVGKRADIGFGIHDAKIRNQEAAEQEAGGSQLCLCVRLTLLVNRSMK